jgi:nucleoside-diphosphate-sugar epimerase
VDKEYTLVTGVTGFIGSHVVERLLSEDRYTVIAVVRDLKHLKNANRLKERGVIFFKGIFYDENVLEEIFGKYAVRNVVHIAALRGAGHGAKKDYYEVNVHGTEVLLEHSLKHHAENFIYCSSVGVCGTIPDELPATVDTVLNGDNYYHNSKILAESKVREFIGKGLNAFIVRPTITYGKGDNGFPFTLVEMVRKRLLVLPFRAPMVHLLHVDSLAAVIVQILKMHNIGSRTFIVADKSAVSLWDLVNAVYYSLYKRRYPVFLRLPNCFFSFVVMFFQLIKQQKWAVRALLISKDWYYDISVATSELNYRPEDTLSCFTGTAKRP